ncbi:hypothetical protein M0805_007769 [Coniferiporia weirii]|nr:hypothetical protein M0805_007769 [Coniferiporia weirii]
MKSVTTSLLILALSLVAFGANLHVRTPGSSGTDNCPSAQVVSTSTYVVDGHEIQRQTFTCPDGGLTKAASTGKTIPRSAFEKRNAAECKNPAPECQCGTSFNCNCQGLTATAPASGDCTILIDSMSVIAQTEGPTFIVEPDDFELIFFHTCALEFTNLGDFPMEYCWENIANIGDLLNEVCFETAPSSSAAACSADDKLWFVQALRVGS